MEKEFIPYEQALALKELGFDELCFGHYQQEWDDDEINELEPSLHMIFSKQHQHAFQSCTAPTFSQSFRWFREKCNIDFSIITNYAKVDSKMIKSYRVGFIIVKNNIIDSYFLRPENNKLKFIEFSTFEDAELECLKKLIEIVKGK